VLDTSTRGERGFHVRALLQLARVLADAPNEHAKALFHFAEAERLALQLGMPPWAALALQGAGMLHVQQGDELLATRAFDAALAIWKRLEAPARIAEVMRHRPQ
jgi:hypothetical protein